MEEKYEFLEKEQSPAIRFLLAKTDRLEKELAELKKDYGRLCQNDSVMRTESSVAFKRLDKQEEEIKELKLIITNLCNECQRLYQTGFSNGVEVARKEYSDELEKLEDMGFISYHGFLKSESKEEFDKWAEANIGKFERTNILTKKEIYNLMKVTQIDPVEAEYYRQVDKAVKEQTLSDLYPTMHCATGSCGGCNELYLVDVKACSGDLFKYTCKKKNITILSNITPKPENFTKEFKKE